MDLGATSSFILEPTDNDTMRRKPRHWSQSFFDSELMTGIVVSAATMCTTVLTSYILAVHHDPQTAQTSAFFTWLYVQVLMAYNLRTFRQPVILKGLFSNVGMLVWLLLTAVLSIVISMSYFVRSNLGLVSLSLERWFLIVFLAAAGTCWIELAKFLVLALQGRKDSSYRSWDSTQTNSNQTAQMLDENVPLTQSV